MAEQLDISLVERQRCAIQFWNPTTLPQAYGDDAMRRKNEHEKVKTACSTIVLKLAANGLHHVFEKWAERCKKCIACQGRYLENETVTTPPQSSDSE
jgi:hypothetical protein